VCKKVIRKIAKLSGSKPFRKWEKSGKLPGKTIFAEVNRQLNQKDNRK
jgi:hypothetical protein